MTITTIAAMRTEFKQRAQLSGLTIDCAMDGLLAGEIAIVAEAPGVSEVAKQLPLIGSSGGMLWSKLRKHSIARMDCYITNVVKRQLLQDDNKKKLNKHELDLWIDLLQWELSQLPNVKYVLALGNYAIQALLGHDGITRWRGSVIDAKLRNGREVKVVCAFNPAAIIREPKNEITFNLDLHKFKRVLDGKHRTSAVNAIINPTYREAMEYVASLRADSVSGGLPVSLDIEVISMETACIGLGNSAIEAMCINFRDKTSQRFLVEEERELRKAIQQLVADPAVKIIAQNGAFDMAWLWYKDAIRIRRIWFDTMLAHHTLYPTLPHNLGFLTTQYTDHPFYKDEKDSWHESGDIDSFWTYNCKDVAHTFEIVAPLLQELREQGLENFFFEQVMRLQPHLVRMTVGGVLIDTSLKERIREELIRDVTTKLNDFHEAVHKATGRTDYFPNPLSPVQMSTLFFRDLKLVGRGTSTDAANRKKMLQHPRTSEDAKKVIFTLDEYVKEHKFLSVYADMQIDEDNRARCDYKQTGVASAPGRLSSSKTLWGSGCLPTDAMALTPYGWRKISTKPDTIAQYNADGTLSFVPATWNIYDHDGPLYSYNGRCFRGDFTANHRVIIQKRNKLYDKMAEQASALSYFSAPVSGTLELDEVGYKISDEELRIWIMCSADGSLEKGSWRVRVSKKRKALRAAMLLGRDIPETDGRGYYNFGRIKGEVYNKLLPDPMCMTLKQRRIMLDELKHWDAHVRGESFIYYTTIKQNAERVQTTAHITGFSAIVKLLLSITVDETNSNEYGNTSTKPLYSVNVSPKSTNAVEGHRWSTKHYSGLVGCPTVPSGMWLVNYNGGIHVTGNSNLQNQPSRAYPMFIADSGYTFVYFDMSQAEARLVAWFANIASWKEQFERARIDGAYDAHRALASDMFGIPYDEVPTADRDDHGNVTVRFIAKRCRHGLNYRMMPDRLAQTTGLPIHEATKAFTIYHEKTPELRDWWGALEHEVRTTRCLYNAYGRRLMILERLEPEALESIVAFKPQSTLGDHVNRVIFKSESDDNWPADARIALNIHDALIGIVPTSKAKQCLSIMKRYAEEPIIIGGEELIIPAECGVGQPDEQGIVRWSTIKKVKHLDYIQ